MIFHIFGQAKLNSKLSALQHFEDIDDSLSNISTVSDDSSDPDSGYEHSNWVSKLAALSEIEESDYEVVPRLDWAEVHNSSENELFGRRSDISHSCSTSFPCDDSDGDCEDTENDISIPNEMISRADWDRILCLERPLYPLPATSIPVLSEVPFAQNLSTTTVDVVGTQIDNETLHSNNDYVTVSGGLRERNNTLSDHLRYSSSPLNNKHVNRTRTHAINTGAGTSKGRSSSWLSNIFRKNTLPNLDPLATSVSISSTVVQPQPTTSSNVHSDSQNSLQSDPRNSEITTDTAERRLEGLNASANELSADHLVIPEIVEIRATCEQVSRSFDDNLELERAEECAEGVSSVNE